MLAGCPTGLVLKAHSATLPHKSEHGLVRIGLRVPDEIVRHFSEIEALVRAMGLAFEGVIAAEMLPPGREMVVGGHLDPVFGPVVMVGDGGMAVEAMPDNVLLLPPFDAAQVCEALTGLRIGPLFTGVRGGRPLDASAVATAAQGVAKLLEDGRARSVDVNPLIVTPDGACAADALVEAAIARMGATSLD